MATRPRSIRLRVDVRIDLDETGEVSVEGDLTGYGEVVESVDPDTGAPALILALELETGGIDQSCGLPYTDYVEVTGRTYSDCVARLLRIAADEVAADWLAGEYLDEYERTVEEVQP